MRSRLLIFWIILLASSADGDESVLGQDSVQSVKISPDGSNIAVLTRRLKIDQLQVVNVVDKDIVLYSDTTPPERIYSFAWLDDEQLVLQMGLDVQYEIDPQRTGKIKLLALSGDSQELIDTIGSVAPLRRNRTGQQLRLIDSLPASSGVMLIESQPVKGLWVVDVRSGVVEAIEYPPIGQANFVVSPNLQYLLADGDDEAGERRAMALTRGVDASWTMLESSLTPLSVNDSGVVHAIFLDEFGFAGVTAFDLKSRGQTVLFEDDEFDVNQVQFDSSNNPFAVRYLPGYPSWDYVGGNQSLIGLHKSLRAALPNGDVSFVSLSSDESVVIAKVIYDDKPPHYHLVNVASGKALRILATDTGLFMVGGEQGYSYAKLPFSIRTESGVRISGFESTPTDGPEKPRPTVVVLRDNPEEFEWQWSYDTDVAFINRMGFNVLMVNHRGSGGYGASFSTANAATAAGDVELAVLWAVQNGIAERDRVCALGRGTGAEIAILAAIRSDLIRCVVSIGGVFANSADFIPPVANEDADTRDLEAFLIYGADDSQDFLATQEAVYLALQSLEVNTDLMVIAGEKRSFSDQNNEVDALSNIALFLREKIGSRKDWLPLPMTFDQAVATNNLMTELRKRLSQHQERIQLVEVPYEGGGGGVMQSWLEKQNPIMRETLSEYQWPLYQSYKGQLFGARR